MRTPYQVRLELSNRNEIGEACSRCGSEDVHIGLWWINVKERGHLEVLDVDGKISRKLDIRK